MLCPADCQGCTCSATPRPPCGHCESGHEREGGLERDLASNSEGIPSCPLCGARALACVPGDDANAPGSWFCQADKGGCGAELDERQVLSPGQTATAGIADEVSPSQPVPCVEHGTECVMRGESHVPQARKAALEATALDEGNQAEAESWAEDWLRARVLEGATFPDRESALEALRDKIAELVPLPGGEAGAEELLSFDPMDDSDPMNSFFDGLEAMANRIVDRVLGEGQQTAHASVDALAAPKDPDEFNAAEGLAQAKDAVMELLAGGIPRDANEIYEMIGGDAKALNDALVALQRDGKLLRQDDTFMVANPSPGVDPDRLRRHQELEKSDGVFRNLSPDPRKGDQASPSAPSDMDIWDIPTMDPRDRQRRLDQLLDRYSEAPEEERPQIEEQMRSLRAFLRRAAGKDALWGAAELAGFQPEIGGGGATVVNLQMGDGRELVFSNYVSEAGWGLMSPGGAEQLDSGDFEFGNAKDLARQLAAKAKELGAHQDTWSENEGSEGLGLTSARRTADSHPRLPSQWEVWPATEFRDADGRRPRWANRNFYVLDSRTDVVGEGDSADAAVEDALDNMLPGQAANWRAEQGVREDSETIGLTAAALPPFPKPGEHKGLWGWIEDSDLDELWFIVNNTSELYHAAMGALNPKGDDTLYAELGPENPEVLEWLRANYRAICRECPPGVPCRECGDPNQAQDLTGGSCPNCVERRGLSHDFGAEDVPVETPDALLDRFNAGGMDEGELARRMRQVSSMARTAESTEVQDALARALRRLKTEQPDAYAAVERALNEELGLSPAPAPQAQPAQAPQQVQGWLRRGEIACGNCGGSGSVDDGRFPGIGREAPCDRCGPARATAAAPNAPTPDAVYEMWIGTEEGERAWEDARSRFPGYNWSQAGEAADFLIDKLELWALQLMDDAAFEELRESLYEAIYAGLT